MQLKTLVDIGDILGVSGSIKRTEKGKFSNAAAVSLVISFLMRCKHKNIYLLCCIFWCLLSFMVKKGMVGVFCWGRWGNMGHSCSSNL